MLSQESYLIVIDVHLTENVLSQRSEEVSSLYEVIDATFFLSLNDCLLVFWVLTVIIA